MMHGSRAASSAGARQQERDTPLEVFGLLAHELNRRTTRQDSEYLEESEAAHSLWSIHPDELGLRIPVPAQTLAHVRRQRLL